MADPRTCLEVTETCQVEDSIYGYYPSLGANVFFCAFFGIALIAHLVLGFRYKTWTYMVALGLGSMTECIGYVGRILLHYNPFNNAGFEAQICCLTLAPAFVAAGIYLTLKHLVLTFGSEHSRIQPKFYTWAFILVDFFSLCLQGSGGGIAATANTNSMTSIGNDLMMSGIAIQAASLFIFSILVIEYFFKVRRNWTTVPIEAKVLVHKTSFRLFAVGVSLATILTFIRCVYRIAEMAGGWQNPIMQDQTDFIVLDGVMVTVATLLLTIFHPGFCFQELSRRSKEGSLEEVSETKLQPSESEGSIA